MEIWSIVGLLNYALIEMIFAEIIALTYIQKQRYFKKSEYYVFSALGLGVLIFFVSGIVQEFIVSFFASYGFWNLIAFVIVFLINVVMIAKFDLDRTWGFRLVLYPLIIIAVIVIAILIHFFVIYKQTTI